MKQNKATILLVLLVLSAITVSAGFFLGVETPTYALGNSVSSVMGVDVSGGTPPAATCDYIHNCSDLNSSIALYYKADLALTYPDELGVYNGTISGSSQGDGKFNNAIYTDGTNSDYIDLGSKLGFSDGDDISIALWVNTSYSTNAGMVFNDYDRGNVNGIFLGLDDDLDNINLANYASSGNRKYIVTDSNPVDEFVFVVATVEGSTGDITLNINGVDQGSQLSSGTVSQSEFSTRDFVIGCQAWFGSKASERCMNGAADEILVAREVYNLTQIGLIYNNGSGLPFD